MYALFPKGNITRNPELQQELERCLKLRDGASRIVLLAQNRLQQLDALKTLFVTNEQVLLCLQRVQREKVEDALSTNQSPDSSASGGNSRSGPVVVRSRHHAQVGLAKLCLSDIRIPLLWRDGPLGVNMQILLQRLFPQSQSLLGTASLLTGAGDSADRTGSGEQCEGGHAVFCLARLGHTVRETRLIFDIRPGTSDVEFDDRLTFDNVTEDFRLVFEIYAYPPSISARAASVFSRCRTLLLDNTRRNLDVLDSAQATGKGSLNFSNFFELIGRSVVTLNDLQNHIRAHALATGPHLLLSSQTLNPPATCLLSTPVSPGSPGDDLKVNGSEANSLTTASDCVTDEALRLNGGQITAPDVWMGTNFSGRGLPLFGSVCFRLVAQPHSAQKPLHTGWLWIRKTLFLDSSPTLRPISVCLSEDVDVHNMQSESDSPENQSPPHPQLPSSMRYHSTSTSTRHSLLSPVDSTQPLPIPATKRPINSPKATRKMRIIKAQARSRSLSNVKLLSSVAATGELDPMMQTPTGPGLAMTLPMRRSTRPTLEDNLPWFNSPSKYRLHSNEPSSSLPDLMLDNVISTRRLSSSMDLICPVTKSKLFQSKGALTETLPRPDRKKRRDVTLNRLSRSLDTICTNQRFLGFTQIGMRTVDTEDTRSLSDAGSVVSEPVPDPPVVECSAAELSQSSTKQLALFTFRIATTSRVLGTTGSLISSPLDEELTPERFTVGCCVKSSEVFEFGVSKPGLQDALKSTVGNTSVSLESDDSALFANAKGTEHWLTMFQAHVAEQSTWGPDAFSKTVRIPEVHSTARDAGTRRSLAFF
ncbi:hypothetical protein FGIG_01242 [Fasciola gigantica]|uniref:Anillin homology domain-containing protein n=1 Tax=Fasciola gigantica TaxID=46835 RepID=A0A504YI63_FASGI|nr:hypothetical protein FGIG_01242 [Fasciola gigantica]